VGARPASFQTETSLALSPPKRKYLERILRNAESTITLVSRIFEPYRQAEREQINVNRLIEEAVNLIGVQDDVEINLALSQQLPDVLTETHGLVSVFQELIINALKAVRRVSEPRRIEITSRSEDVEYVEILFTNNGPPIPREHWETIFELFAIGNESMHEPEGFGWGLWGSRVFIKRQDGDIVVLESNENTTTFIVRIPVASQQEE